MEKRFNDALICDIKMRNNVARVSKLQKFSGEEQSRITRITLKMNRLNPAIPRGYDLCARSLNARISAPADVTLGIHRD
jgi:hypothetical protein